jgi:hypothetical protein
MLLSRHQKPGQNHNIKVANRSFGNVAQLKYLGITVTNQNLIQEETKRRLIWGNACYHKVQNLLFSRLSKNVKMRIYETIILPVVLYGCETWSLTLREEHGLRVFENRVLWRIFGQKRDEVVGGWRKLHNEELQNLYCSPSIIRIIKWRMRWAGLIAPMWEESNAYRILVGKPEGKRPCGRPTRRLRWIFDKWDEVVWTGLIWLRMVTGGGPL